MLKYVKIVCNKVIGGGWMLYKVRSEGIIVRSFIVISVFSFTSLMKIIGISIPIFVIVLICYFKIISFISSFELTVDTSFLEVRRGIIGRFFYKKRLRCEQIKEIKFIRVGWKGKGAIIKINKGFSYSITGYEPDTIIRELMEFAGQNQVPVIKTKDFRFWKSGICKKYLNNYINYVLNDYEEAIQKFFSFCLAFSFFKTLFILLH